MIHYWLLKPGFSEDTVIYELRLVQRARLPQATIQDIEDKLDQLHVTNLVIDAGYPNIIDRLRLKFLIKKLLRRKVNE